MTPVLIVKTQYFGSPRNRKVNSHFTTTSVLIVKTQYFGSPRNRKVEYPLHADTGLCENCQRVGDDQNFMVSSATRDLATICTRTVQMCGRTENLISAADDLGIALISEVREHAPVLASTVGLKALEEKRFLNAVLDVPIQPIRNQAEDCRSLDANKTLPCRDDEEDDVFGFGPCT